MYKLTSTGKYFFAAGMLGFGIIQFITGSLPSEFMPLPKEMAGKAILAYLTGAILIASAICIFINKMAKSAAITIAALFLIFLVYPHIPKLLSNVYNPGEWVAFLETLAFFSGGIIVANTLDDDNKVPLKVMGAIRKFSKITVYLFAVAMLIFGIQHIMYEKFIVTLIPEWIPAKTFWSYVVKAGFLGTALSIIINIQTKLSTFLLGIMFLTWVLILHAPRAINKVNVEPEWTSLFVAMTMCGICFVISKTQLTKSSAKETETGTQKMSAVT